MAGRYYIGTKDINFDNSICYTNGVAIPSQYLSKFKTAPKDSVLMCIEGGSAGKKIGLLDQEVCFGNKLCCFTSDNVESKYIYYYLQTSIFFELFKLKKSGIIGGVSIAKVKEIIIPIPPKEEQMRIITQIEKLFEQLS